METIKEFKLHYGTDSRSCVNGDYVHYSVGITLVGIQTYLNYLKDIIQKQQEEIEYLKLNK